MIIMDNYGVKLHVSMGNPWSSAWCLHPIKLNNRPFGDGFCNPLFNLEIV